MSRDPEKLRVFDLADSLVVDVYQATTSFPSEERYGLQSQLRRAALSAAANIVEGCARRTTAEYVHFLNVATGSAAEGRYLLGLAARLGLLNREVAASLTERCTVLLIGLQQLIRSLGGSSYPPRPKAQSLKPRA
jgi:four helix bundle protein